MNIKGAKRRPLTVLACVLAAGIIAPAAFAASWAEGTSGTGDAGELPATAQRPSSSLFGPTPFIALDTISGTLSSSTDRDMYRICKLPAGSASATTVGTPGTLSDTQLFLFNGSGLGVRANDDSVGLRSTLPSEVLGWGVYYLAVSTFDSDPVSVGGLIFPSTPFTGVFGPTGPGGGSPISGWQGLVGTGTYTISLTGWQVCGIF